MLLLLLLLLITIIVALILTTLLQLLLRVRGLFVSLDQVVVEYLWCFLGVMMVMGLCGFGLVAHH